jgi:replicative DNA helicase
VIAPQEDAYRLALDFVTLAEKLKADGAFEGDRGKMYLLQLAQMVPSIANVRAYAGIVSGSARARRLRQVISEAAAASVTAGNVDEIAEKLQSDAHGCMSGSVRRGLKPLSDIATGWYENLFKDDSKSRVDTGFGDLDEILKGMWAGNLILLAARPAVGKSAFAQAIAKHVARSGMAVAVFSCEMEDDEQFERMVSEQSGVGMDFLIDSASLRGRQPELDAIARGVDELYRLPVYLSDNAAVTTAGIRAQCRMIKNLGLIIVDYVQLLQGSRRAENRNAEVAAISRELKLIAGDLKVPVLALSQLNREVERRGSREPELSDLRDSGGLEQDGNKVLFMWEADPERHIVAVSVKKNRRGGRGVAQFVFDGAHMRYRQLVKSDYVQIGGGASGSGAAGFSRAKKYPRYDD